MWFPGLVTVPSRGGRDRIPVPETVRPARPVVAPVLTHPRMKIPSPVEQAG